MRLMALLAGMAATALLATTATPAPAQTAPPYPRSTLLTGLTWDTGTYRWSGADGDLWPMTLMPDGTMRTAWGDARLGCSAKVSYGVARIASATPTTTRQIIHCGPAGTGNGKLLSLLAAGSSLYAIVDLQRTGDGFPIWRSGDGGRTWSKPGWAFSNWVESFVQYGKAKLDAPGGFAFLLDARGTEIHLLRAPQDRLQDRSAYQWFSGTTNNPAWSVDASRSKPIFVDPAGTYRPVITFNPGLGRYLLTVSHARTAQGSAGRLGVFEAPQLRGPWRTVYYADNFLGMRDGQYLGVDFPIKWQADGGRTLWAVINCYDLSRRGSCGRYHDRFNLMRARLTVAGR